MLHFMEADPKQTRLLHGAAESPSPPRRENLDSGVWHSKLCAQHLPLPKSFDVCVSIVP